ncbi:hypothetical protein [Aliarcobacter butzleri]|uniref:hypothetical protein n=1 Tax=Aliarcobacter butzleri TaxID=28197 RepID=UPI003AF68474
MKEFEATIKQLFEYVHEYALNNLELKPDNPPQNWTPEEINKFTEYVHIGFKKGQELVLDEMLKYENNLFELNKTLKLSRKEKNKDLEKETQNTISLIDYKISILRIFIDFIAWQFLGQQYYKVRRFYDMNKKYNSRPTLSKSNIESVKSVVDYYHSLNPLNFALISDLTTFIDIGDILLMDNYQVIPIEVKEGQKNKEVFEFLFEQKIPSNPEIIDDKFIKQMERVLNQAERGKLLTDVLQNEKGLDPFTKLETNVNDKAFEIETYILEFKKMIDGLKDKNYSYNIIEDVISLGIYQKDFIMAGNTLIPFLNKQMFGKDYPVINFRYKFQIPVTEPIFYLGLSKETIFDIFFGRINIIISINLDKFIELCNLNGLDAGYLSKKETMKRKQNGEIELFEFERQNIKINGSLIDGLISRMIFDFVKPSSIIKYLKIAPKVN